ncbi:FecR domain-containing protein [Lignipirellula cremea]|nr:FecR domain-containing protein [Lignipirellula cremea]
MNDKPNQLDRLQQLADIAWRGELSRAEARELEDLLTDDPEAQECFVDYFQLDAELRMIVNSQQSLKTVRERIEAVEVAGAPRSGVATDSPGLGRPRVWRFSAAIAISLLIAFGWFVIRDRWSPPENETVAILKAMDGCRWEAEPLSVGDELRTGQTFRLKEGVVEIQFASGATVVLKGPAALQLDSARGAHLQNGTLSAFVPSQAVGFVIDAPGLKVVDLGTRFGLTTTAGGATEVHVFEGQVQASLVDRQGESLQTVTLKKSEAAVIEPVKLTLSQSAAALDQFVFDHSLKQDSARRVPLAINGGSSWEGWTLQGASNQLGIYGSGSTDDVYNIYTTVFTFDNHTVSGKPAGSAGFAPGAHSVGAFANGHTVLGIGIERTSGSPIATPTVKFDLGNDSYAAASSVGGEDGKTNDSNAHAGDFNTQFNYDQRNTWKTETLAVFDGLGKFGELTGNRVTYDYAFRAFAVKDPASNQTFSCQLFFDLDAMDALYGPGNPGVGIGAFGSTLTFAINGAGSNHAVIENLSLVPGDHHQKPPSDIRPGKRYPD